MIETGGRTLLCVRVVEKTSTGFCWGSRAVIPLEVSLLATLAATSFLTPFNDCATSDDPGGGSAPADGGGGGGRGAAAAESLSSQLNLNRPLRISPGPRHLSRPLTAISTYANRPVNVHPVQYHEFEL